MNYRNIKYFYLKRSRSKWWIQNYRDQNCHKKKSDTDYSDRIRCR